jgi:hypothetical protein
VRPSWIRKGSGWLIVASILPPLQRLAFLATSFGASLRLGTGPETLSARAKLKGSRLLYAPHDEIYAQGRFGGIAEITAGTKFHPPMALIEPEVKSRAQARHEIQR